MTDDSMNDMVKNSSGSGTPLSIFKTELSKFKKDQKQKNFLYVTLPIAAVIVLVGGYFAYHTISLKKEEKTLNTQLAKTIQVNEAILTSSEQVVIPDKVLSSVNKTVDEIKTNTKYGISREELERIKNSK